MFELHKCVARLLAVRSLQINFVDSFPWLHKGFALTSLNSFNIIELDVFISKTAVKQSSLLRTSMPFDIETYFDILFYLSDLLQV